jgi:tRNA threonylcarbamoyl adenosine modification protein (Sua5/YciO/YrdC/YwlC family)
MFWAGLPVANNSLYFWPIEMAGFKRAVAKMCRYNPRMARIVEIHPRNPQPRLIADVVATIRDGGLIVYPTDSSFAFGCHIGDKRAIDRIRRIRQTDKKHNFTLVCSDLSEISVFARVENWAYRLIKSLTPGPYTFILQASREVPKRLQNPKRRTIGLRVPDHVIVHEMLRSLGEPIMSSTLLLPGDDLPLTDVYEIGGEIDLIIDGGPTGIEPTTVIDLSEGKIQILRQGLGDVSMLT